MTGAPANKLTRLSVEYSLTEHCNISCHACAQASPLLAKKFADQEDFTLDDFLDQLIAVRRMGPIANVLAMMPGMGQMKDQLAELDDKHFDRVTAIIRSMTPGERTNPKIINGSRRARIANGSGVAVMDVNQLLNRF